MSDYDQAIWQVETELDDLQERYRIIAEQLDVQLPLYHFNALVYEFEETYCQLRAQQQRFDELTEELQDLLGKASCLLPGNYFELARYLQNVELAVRLLDSQLRQ